MKTKKHPRWATALLLDTLEKSLTLTGLNFVASIVMLIWVIFHDPQYIVAVATWNASAAAIFVGARRASEYLDLRYGVAQSVAEASQPDWQRYMEISEREDSNR